MATNLEGRSAAVVAPLRADQNRSYVDWPAIIAGAVLASAISFVLLTFGSAIGLSFASDSTIGDRNLLAVLAASGLWLVWVQVSSFAAGGYFSGRLRHRLFDATEHEVHMRDGMHGVLVWGLGILLGGVFAAAAITGVAGVGVGLAKAGIAAAGEAADGDMGGDMDEGGIGDALGYDIDRLLRGAPRATMTTGAVTAPAAQPRDDRSEIGRIVTFGLDGDAGDVPQEDRAYIAQLVAERAGISNAEAQQRVDAFVEEARTEAAEAEAAGAEAAEAARMLGVLVAFTATVSLLISAVAAWWGARLGGRHRDEGTVLAWLVPPRRA